MESSNSNSKERELQLTQRLAKQRHSNCMTWFEQLETHLHDLYLLNSPYAVDAFKPAFRSFFGEEHQTFKLKMFHNLDQLRLQLERENLHGVNAKTCLQALRTQFKEFLASKGVNATDLLNQGWQQDFEDFTRCEPSAYRRELLENLDTLEAVIHRVVNTYGVLRMKENELNALKENGSQLHDEILHEHQIKSSVKMQSQDIQINPVQAMDDSLIVSKHFDRAEKQQGHLGKSKTETRCKATMKKVNMREAVDAGLVVTESSGTTPDKQDTSSSSGNYTTQAVDADIRLVNDDEPFAEVQLTALHNILANEQQHTEQSEPNYDTHLSRGRREIYLTWNLQENEMNRSIHFLRTVIDWNGKPSLRFTEVGQRILSSTFQLIFHEHNFVRSFTASSNFPSIYISWSVNTLTHDAKTGVNLSAITDAEEEALQEKFMLAQQELLSGPDPKPLQEDQTIKPGKLHDQFLLGQTTEDDQRRKLKLYRSHDSHHISDPSHQTVTSTPPVIAPFIDVSSIKPSSLVSPPPINTEATTITTSLPEITPFIALQLRVARLEQEMSEVKKTDHSADVLASIKSQMLSRNTLVAWPESNQESRILKEAKGESDQKGNKVRRHKNQLTPSGPSAGSNQGRSAKRRRPGSAASGSAQPPSKDDHQSSKKPRESDASASKQHPALTSTGWQITDTRDDKRSSDSSKKLKGIQTLTPAEQEAADIMKALKESKKMSKRQPGTGGSNEGTGNILGVPDESTVISRASSEGTGSKPGVPDEEKLIL
ncbi:hypothetical protein Tco_0500516 [Tanacetum coccineum]